MSLTSLRFYSNLLSCSLYYSLFLLYAGDVTYALYIDVNF
jgi:hypothetical protein